MKDKFLLYKLMQHEPPILIEGYNLVGHTPVLATSLFAWGVQFKHNRVVKSEIIDLAPWYRSLLGFHDDHYISTVFLGLDHNFFDGEPLLFETMIDHKGGWLDYQTRCSTWSEAISMHYAAKKWLRDK